MIKGFTEGNSHVKVCVASRPWNVFQTALKQKPSLRLEDLTFDDIKSFVQFKFYVKAEFENLRQRYPSFADQLMENIVRKASGVFLWVDLVVASLLAGMRVGDRILDFQRRLDELPPDLEKLYEKILHSLDPFYLEHAAQYFTLIESAKASLTILELSFADEESPRSAIKMSLGSMTEEEISLRIEAASRRINSRCKGFLEIERGLQSIQNNDMCHPSQLTVQYLHRTVKDFINTPKARSFLQSSVNPDFDPSIQLCVAYLMGMKASHGLRSSSHLVNRELFSAPSIMVIPYFRQAAGIAKASEGAMIELLDELKAVFKHPVYSNDPIISFMGRELLMGLRTHSTLGSLSIIRKSLRPDQANYASFCGDRSLEPFISGHIDKYFLYFAVKHNVVPYVRARAEWGGIAQLSYPNRPVFRFPLLLGALFGDVPEPTMVECLLDLGADPNFKLPEVDSQTPWTRALTKVTLLYTIQGNLGNSAEYSEAEEKWKQTLRLMFLRGADRAIVPESLLTPISRKILRELRNEVETQVQSPSGWTSWFRG